MYLLVKDAFAIVTVIFTSCSPSSLTFFCFISTEELLQINLLIIETITQK